MSDRRAGCGFAPGQRTRLVLASSRLGGCKGGPRGGKLLVERGLSVTLSVTRPVTRCGHSARSLGAVTRSRRLAPRSGGESRCPPRSGGKSRGARLPRPSPSGCRAPLAFGLHSALPNVGGRAPCSRLAPRSGGESRCPPRSGGKSRGARLPRPSGRFTAAAGQVVALLLQSSLPLVCSTGPRPPGPPRSSGDSRRARRPPLTQLPLPLGAGSLQQRARAGRASLSESSWSLGMGCELCATSSGRTRGVVCGRARACERAGVRAGVRAWERRRAQQSWHRASART